eukprot:sb/3460541/
MREEGERLQCKSRYSDIQPSTTVSGVVTGDTHPPESHVSTEDESVVPEERVEKVEEQEKKPSQVVVKGEMGGYQIRCFLDSGSSICLVNRELVQRMGLIEKIIPTKKRHRDRFCHELLLSKENKFGRTTEFFVQKSQAPAANSSTVRERLEVPVRSPVIIRPRQGAFLGEDQVFPLEQRQSEARTTLQERAMKREEVSRNRGRRSPFVGPLIKEAGKLFRRAATIISPRLNPESSSSSSEDEVRQNRRVPVPPREQPRRNQRVHENEDSYWYGHMTQDGQLHPMPEAQERQYREWYARQSLGMPPRREDPPPPLVLDLGSREESQREYGTVEPPRDQRVSPGRNGRRRWRPKIKVPEFKAGGDMEEFEMFLEKFKRYLLRVDWEWDQLQDELLESISCKEIYKKVNRLYLSPEEQADPEWFIAAIKSAIVYEERNEEEERRKLTQMKQCEGESVEEFADRIRDTAEFAFPEETHRVVDQRMIEALQDGLRDTRVSELVCNLRRSRIDFGKVVKQAATRDRMNKMFQGEVYKPHGRRDETVFQVEEITPLEKTRSTVSQIGAGVPAASTPKTPVAECEKCGKKGHSGENCWASMTCQLCRETGHIAHQCPRYMYKSGESRGPRLGGNSYPRQPGCFECGSLSHRVAECPRTGKRQSGWRLPSSNQPQITDEIKRVVGQEGERWQYESRYPYIRPSKTFSGVVTGDTHPPESQSSTGDESVLPEEIRVEKVEEQEKKPNQVVVEGEMRGHQIRCFLDSGSSICLVNRELVQRMGLVEKIVPTKKRVCDFSGNPIPLFGTIGLTFSLASRQISQCFVVCGAMDTEVLLGHDFFTATRCSLDYGKKQLAFPGGEKVSFFPRVKSVGKSHLIRGLSGQVIPGDSVAYIQGRLPEHLKPCVGMITPFGAVGEDGLLVASAVAEGRNRRVTLKVVNISSDPVEIRNKQVLGRFEPIPGYSPISGVQWGELSTRSRQQPKSAGREMNYLTDSVWRTDIRLKEGAEPRWTNPIPVPYKLREEMDRNIQKMMEVGVIEELNEPSDWNSPIFLVKKKTAGAWRLVADLRCVNQECVGDSYPLPNLNHVLDSIGGDSIFSNFDLSKGFWQVPYTQESKKVTSFLYRGRQLCFARCIMGHKASSSKFTRMMQKLLGTLPIEQVIYFVDDVFLSSKTVEEHLNRLERLLARFESANLKISPGKTELLKKEVEFVGISIGGEGVRITDQRVAALTALPTPKSRKEVSEVLGAFNYIRKWVPGYSAITKPLHNLLSGPKNREFVWSAECEKAYQELKTLIAEKTLLSIPDPEDPFQSFEVTVDASVDGYAATLSQELERDGVRERKIVAFFSKSVPNYKRSRGQTRLEFDAMVAALEHWRVYLLNTRFTVVTDCKSLLSAEDSLFAKSNPTIIRKVQLLAEFDFDIRHISGESNTLADFLSRFPHRHRMVEASPISEMENLRGVGDQKEENEDPEWEGHEPDQASPISEMENLRGVGDQKEENEDPEWEGHEPDQASPISEMENLRGVGDQKEENEDPAWEGHEPDQASPISEIENLVLLGCELIQPTSLPDRESLEMEKEVDSEIEGYESDQTSTISGSLNFERECGADLPTQERPSERLLEENHDSVDDLIPEDDVTEVCVSQLHGRSSNGRRDNVGDDSLYPHHSTGDIPVSLSNSSAIGELDTVMGGVEETDGFGLNWLFSCDQGQVQFRPIHHVEPSCWCSTNTASTRIEHMEVDAIREVAEGTIEPLMSWREWENAQKEDDLLRVVRTWVNQGRRDVLQANRAPSELESLWKQFNLLRVEDGVLQRKWANISTGEDRWLILVPLDQRESVMNRGHGMCGHAGVSSTLQGLRRWYYWPGMEGDVKSFVGACVNCGANKQPIAYGRAAMARVMFHNFNDAIVIDHIVPSAGGRTPRGHTAILTISDAWSNFVVAVPVKSQTSDENRERILENWVYRMGWPREIICDNHGGFRGAAFRRFFELHGVKITYGTAYNAASTARAESNNKRTNMVLRATLHESSPHNWDLHLSKVSFVLNSLKNRRTGFTANRLVYGQELNIPEILMLERDGSESEREENIPKRVYERAKELRTIARRVRKNMEVDWGYAKRQYDKRAYNPGYSVGDKVFVRINCPVHKYGPRWSGPFELRLWSRTLMWSHINNH